MGSIRAKGNLEANAHSLCRLIIIIMMMMIFISSRNSWYFVTWLHTHLERYAFLVYVLTLGAFLFLLFVRSVIDVAVIGSLFSSIG